MRERMQALAGAVQHEVHIIREEHNAMFAVWKSQNEPEERERRHVYALPLSLSLFFSLRELRERVHYLLRNPSRAGMTNDQRPVDFPAGHAPLLMGSFGTIGNLCPCSISLLFLYLSLADRFEQPPAICGR